MRTELESRAGIEPLDQLQAERRLLLVEYAGLKSLHGPFGKFDHFRKQLVEALKVRVRLRLLEKEVKVTESMIDAMAHNEPEYLKLLEDGQKDATRYIVLEMQVTELEERIENRLAMLRMHTRELGLT